jgi:oligosaccharide repeat unit polymerase
MTLTKSKNSFAKIMEWPEIYVPATLWLIVILLSVLKCEILNTSISFNTILVVVLFASAYAAGVLISGVEASAVLGKFREHARRPPNWLGLVSIISLVMAFGAFLYIRRAVVGTDIESARTSRGDYSAIDLSFGPVYAIFCPFAAIAGYAIIACKNHWLVRMVGAVAVPAAMVGCFLLTGSRYEFMPNMLCLFATFLLLKAHIISAHWRKFMFVGMTGLVLLLCVNIMLNSMGYSDGMAANSSRAMVNNASLLLGSSLSGSLPTELLFAVGIIDEYLLTSVGFLEHYLHVNDYDLCWGSHSFGYIARRFGQMSGAETKEMVDALYTDVGVHEGVNVWATLVREIAMDFGVGGSLVFSLLIGIITGKAKKLSAQYWSAQVVYAVLFALMMFSPFTSLFKSSIYQLGFYFAISMLLIEAQVSKTKPTKIVRVQNQRNNSISNRYGC